MWHFYVPYKQKQVLNVLQISIVHVLKYVLLRNHHDSSPRHHFLTATKTSYATGDWGKKHHDCDILQTINRPISGPTSILQVKTLRPKVSVNNHVQTSKRVWDCTMLQFIYINLYLRFQKWLYQLHQIDYIKPFFWTAQKKHVQKTLHTGPHHRAAIAIVPTLVPTC